MRRFTTLVVAVLAFAVCPVAAQATCSEGNSFGTYYLPFASYGGVLDRTRSKITTPASAGAWTLPNLPGRCALARSDAETTATESRLLQVGFVRCAQGGLDGLCGANGNLENFVETLDPVYGYTCWDNAYRAVSYNTTHKYSVLDGNHSGVWFAWIDGVNTYVDNQFGDAYRLHEGMEYVSPLPTESFTVSAPFGSQTPLWEYFNGSTQAWTQVSSTNYAPCLDAGWSVTGTPPGPFTFSH